MLMFSPVRNERGDARGGAYLWNEDFFDAIRWGRPRLRTGLNLHGTCHFTHFTNLVMGPGGEGEARGTGQTSHQLWGSYIRLSRAAVSSRRRASPRKRLAASRATLPRSFCCGEHGRVKLPGNGVHFGAYCNMIVSDPSGNESFRPDVRRSCDDRPVRRTARQF